MIKNIFKLHKYNKSIIIIFLTFITAYSLTQHQDVENHMLPGERQTTSSKRLGFKAKCQGRGMEIRDPDFIVTPDNITYNRTSLNECEAQTSSHIPHIAPSIISWLTLWCLIER